MVIHQAHPLARFLQHFAATAAALPDVQLLERFAGLRDGDAFAALVRRHGPMVLAVCRRVLGDGDWHAAEDAFQATFLVLAQKAGSLRQPQSLGPWLHGVAQRTALKARTGAARRRFCEQQASTLRPEAVLPPDPFAGEWQALLDDAIARLPQRYQAPLVLCYLEGRSVSQAAVELGWPRGTVATRLARARIRLKRHLTGKGLALSVPALTLALADHASAAISAGLARSTAMAALQFTDGSAQASVSGSVPETVAALAKEVLQVMVLSKIRIAAVALLALTLIGIGLAVVCQGPTFAAAQVEPPAQTKPVPPAQDSDTAKRPPLPKGPAPTQAVAVVREGKLLTIQVAEVIKPVTITPGNGPQTITTYQRSLEHVATETALEKVTAYSTRGEVIDAKRLNRMLAKETLVLVTQEWDPLQVRLVKDGTLILVLPVTTRPVMPPAALGEDLPTAPALPPPAPIKQ
jgi:RNA polymerase sigma factor (sigma-70 family)